VKASRGRPGTGKKSVGVSLAPRAAIVAALRRMLRPLVRMLVAHGITYPFLTEMLKSVFVETAASEFTLDGQRPTDSRLTVLTGVHRKDIRRLLREPEPEPETPPCLTLGTQIVARWLGDRAYCDDMGKPLALPRTPSQGGDHSFAALVESVSKNVRPRSVLDELKRLGVVAIDANDYVHLITSGFVPGKELDAKAFYFGEAMHDHLAAGAHNLEEGARPFFERSVYYDELSPEAVELLRAQAEKLSMEVLKEINKRGMALERGDPPEPERRMRMRLGIYFFSSKFSPASPTEPAPKREKSKPERRKPRSRK
jgi:uncharacterized protein DUF6502